MKYIIDMQYDINIMSFRSFMALIENVETSNEVDYILFHTCSSLKDMLI